MRFSRRSAAFFLCLGAWLFAPRLAHAQSSAQILRASVIGPANDAIRSALSAHATVGQARPVGEQEAPLAAPALPMGFSYTLDASIAYPLGNTGSSAKLPGGIDAVAAYGFSSHLRATAAYFDFQEYPIGFNTGSVPVYLQGLSAPIATTDLHSTGQDATIKNHIVVLGVQSLVRIGKHLPIIITPTYIARSGSVGGHSDEQLVEINGFPQTVRVRTVEYELLAVTAPFLSTSRMFGTLTLAPQWLVNTNGANQTNHAQLFGLLYLEYRVNPHTTVFVQPSRLANFLPTDPAPQFIPTLVYGVTHTVAKHVFVQLIGSTGTPSNRARVGITSVTCQALPCAPNQVAPAIDGLKAAQFQVMLGIGSPSVIPL